MASIESEAIRLWQHAGLDCATRSSGIGFINGYVRLPEGHFAHGMGYDQLNRAISIHGGLTYGSDSDGWVGFDTGHAGDYWPGETERHTLRDVYPWDIAKLEIEVQSLASQLAALTSLPEPESSWDCSEAEFQELLHDAKAWREHVARVGVSS